MVSFTYCTGRSLTVSRMGIYKELDVQTIGNGAEGSEFVFVILGVIEFECYKGYKVGTI